MSLTQTTTLTQVEPLSDLQRRLQPFVGEPQKTQQIRFRAQLQAPGPKPSSCSKPSLAQHATLARRFSFVWPFISKENTISSGSPFLSSCSQLLSQFPFFLGGGYSGAQFRSGRDVREAISRLLQHLNRLWLLLAVYLAVFVLAGLTATLGYTFWCAAKPLGLWFLVGCIGATGVLALVSFSVRAKAPPGLLAQDSRANLQ